jgi:hypothetical protein
MRGSTSTLTGLISTIVMDTNEREPRASINVAGAPSKVGIDEHSFNDLAVSAHVTVGRDD